MDRRNTSRRMETGLRGFSKLEIIFCGFLQEKIPLAHLSRLVGANMLVVIFSIFMAENNLVIALNLFGRADL